MIAVLGATGTIGTQLSRRLAESDAPARALVRDPAKAGPPLPAVAADLADPDSLRAALEGAEQLFLLTPQGPDQELHEKAALEAAIAAGVRRVVKVSGTAPSLGPNGAAPTAVAHWRSERRIEASGLRFALLRPCFLMQNLFDLRPRFGLLPAPMGRAPIAMVDARDVADAAFAVLRDEVLPDRAWQLTGPAGVSFDEVASQLGARYLPVPPWLAAKALRRRGASGFEIDHALRMAAYFASGADGAPSGDVERLTGRAPRSLSSFVSDQLPTKGK